MNRLAMLCCVPMIGCGGSAVGDWEGECAYTVGGDLSAYEVEIEVVDVKKGDINGTARVIDDQQRLSNGTLDGQQDKKDLTLKVKFIDGAREGDVFELIGELDGRQIFGDFSLGSHTGDCELERQE